MDPTVRAFLLGYRQGREGLPSSASIEMTEAELADMESANPPPSAHEWMWHMMGWTAGQAEASFEMARR